MNFIKLNKTNIYVKEEETIYKKDKEYKKKGCLCRGKVSNGKFIATNDMVHFHSLHKEDVDYQI